MEIQEMFSHLSAKGGRIVMASDLNSDQLAYCNKLDFINRDLMTMSDVAYLSPELCEKWFEAKPKKEEEPKIREISITFPVAVNFPVWFERALTSLVEMVCKLYEKNNPGRSMWVFGSGSQPITDCGDITGFNDAVYMIEIAERKKYQRTDADV